LLDLVGTYAFATSGALAAKEKQFDLFGVGAIADAVACGGGILRDLSIGAIPPAGPSDGAEKASALGHNAQVAALLGMTTAIGVTRPATSCSAACRSSPRHQV
jgi:uncharacterized membrane protein YeiH